MQEPSPAPLVQAFLSSAVNLNIKLLVQNLHGSMPEMESRGLGYTECLSERTGCTAADLYLEFQLFVHGQPLGLPERTCNMPGSRLRWNEWITFRAKYCDLSADASEAPHAHAFEVVTHERTYHLAAASKDDLQGWLSALNKSDASEDDGTLLGRFQSMLTSKRL